MAAVAALLTLEPPAVDEAMLMAIPAGQLNPSGQRALSREAVATQKPKGFTLLVSAVEPLERLQGVALLELDAAVPHSPTSTGVLG